MSDVDNGGAVHVAWREGGKLLPNSRDSPRRCFIQKQEVVVARQFYLLSPSKGGRGFMFKALHP